MGSRTTKPFPDNSVLHCRAGLAAAKGNITESAVLSFRQALALNSMLWDAFEGLCSLGKRSSFVHDGSDLRHAFAVGQVPGIDELFPPRPAPVKQTQLEDARPIPVATGAGFFTPDAGNGGNLFRAWKPDAGQLQPLQMGHVGPRDSM